MTIKKDKKTALIFGATGLVGGHCIRALLAQDTYQKVLSFGRRTVALEHPKLEQIIIDFDQMEDYAQQIQGQDIFICLGTTRAKAGKDGFVKVDFDYTFNAAKYAAINGANQLILVSSVGADPDSLFFYTKIKGQLEEAVKRLPFWAVHILQPSFLMGNRQDFRLGERLATAFSNTVNRISDGLLGIYTPVEAETVAKAMVQLAQGLEGGIFYHSSDSLIRIITEKKLQRR